MCIFEWDEWVQHQNAYSIYISSVYSCPGEKPIQQIGRITWLLRKNEHLLGRARADPIRNWSNDGMQQRSFQRKTFYVSIRLVQSRLLSNINTHRAISIMFLPLFFGLSQYKMPHYILLLSSFFYHSQLSESDFDRRLLITVYHVDENVHEADVLGCMSFGLRHLIKRVCIVFWNMNNFLRIE